MYGYNRVSSAISTISYLCCGNNSSAEKMGLHYPTSWDVIQRLNFPMCKVFIWLCGFWEWLFKRRWGRGFLPLSVKTSSRLYPGCQLGLLVFIVILVEYTRMKEWDEFITSLNPDGWYVGRDRKWAYYQKLHRIYRQVNFTEKD